METAIFHEGVLYMESDFDKNGFLKAGACPVTEVPGIIKQGVKYDDDKLDWSLLPLEEMEDVVEVLMHGARKYPQPDNWKRVPDLKRRYYNAAMRHVARYWQGEEMDQESYLPHLAHAICCLLFMMWKDNHDLKGE